MIMDWNGATIRVTAPSEADKKSSESCWEGTEAYILCNIEREEWETAQNWDSVMRRRLKVWSSPSWESLAATCLLCEHADWQSTRMSCYCNVLWWVVGIQWKQPFRSNRNETRLFKSSVRCRCIVLLFTMLVHDVQTLRDDFEEYTHCRIGGFSLKALSYNKMYWSQVVNRAAVCDLTRFCLRWQTSSSQSTLQSFYVSRSTGMVQGSFHLQKDN